MTFSSPWLTKEEAVEYGRVTAVALEAAMRSGELEYRKIGPRFVFHVAWIDAWLEAMDPPAAAGATG